MSTTDITPYATTEDVRQNLHLEDWDVIGIPETQVYYYIQNRAAPLVAEELDTPDHDIAEWRLTQIEALLAAHWMAMSNESSLRQAMRSASDSGAYDWYAGNNQQETGLRATTMGQSAIELDPTGVLADMADADGAGSGPFWSASIQG